MAIQETIRQQADFSTIGAWIMCLNDMFKGDKDRVLDRIILLCQERFLYGRDVEDKILELMEVL